MSSIDVNALLDQAFENPRLNTAHQVVWAITLLLEPHTGTPAESALRRSKRQRRRMVVLLRSKGVVLP